MSEESDQHDFMKDYVRRRYVENTNPPRKYWNHLAQHSAGEWRRYHLLSSGQYIKTSDPDEYARRPNIYEQAGILTHQLSETTNHGTV